MTCEHFGQCGSCTLHYLNYDEQLQYKITSIKDDFNIDKIDIIKSPTSNFRYRAEFKTYFDGDKISYAMSGVEVKKIKINSCSIVSKKIVSLMRELLYHVEKSDILKQRLFTVEFLTTSTNEVIITLIYHKKVDEAWMAKAEELASKLGSNIIGRSKKVKLVVGDDFIYEELTIHGKKYKYQILDTGFTQPNPKVNEQMIEWVLDNISHDNSDLLELYCGLGNFTLPLSYRFNKVLATEISKNSIKCALKNCELNGISNIDFIRLSSKELVEALNKVREFRRLKDIELDEYNFSHIFIDPPRAGLDSDTLEFIKKFDNIIYISCNPDTLKRDLELLSEFKVKRFAAFDQFPYTHHLECGVILSRD